MTLKNRILLPSVSTLLVAQCWYCTRREGDAGQ